MADDLGDEWWEEPSESADPLSDNDDVKKEERTKQIHAQKRKKVASVTSPKLPAKKKKPVKESVETKPEKDAGKKSKRRKKKTITDVLETTEPKAGTQEDLQNLLLQYFGDKRSVIELEELKIPDTCFLQSNDLTHTLSSYMKEICPKWSKLVKNHKKEKSVLLLLVCSSAYRALELIKLIKAFKGDTKIIKMFGKHIKITDQSKLLEKNVIHIGVGTPGRIKVLIEKDVLSLESLKYVVIDWNCRDVKLRRMMDIPEVKKDMLDLMEKGIISACREGSLKLGLF